MMVFFAVAREGLESVFFLLAAFQQDVGIWPPLGAMLGLATAVVLGFLLYWGGIRLNLGAFFKWTSLFILFVAAGLAWNIYRLTVVYHRQPVKRTATEMQDSILRERHRSSELYVQPPKEQ